MKFSNKKIKSFIFKAKQFGKDADADWMVLIVISCLGLLASLLYSGVLYFYIVSENNESLLPETTSKQELIDKNALTKLLEYYDQKQENFDGAKLRAPNIIDPSK